MLPGVCPRRWITEISLAPTGTVSPWLTRLVTRTGSSSASSGWAMTAAPVAACTSASACQWSQCRWVVTIRLSGRPPTSSSSLGASLAASISTSSPVCVHCSRYALLSIGPTASLVTVRPEISLASGGPPTVTSPVYATVSPSLRVPISYQTTRRGARRRQHPAAGPDGQLTPCGQHRGAVSLAGYLQPGTTAAAEQPGQQCGGLPAHHDRRAGGARRADPVPVRRVLGPDQATRCVVPAGERVGDPVQRVGDE